MASRLINKIKDRMLLGSIYDNIMLKTKYKGEHLEFNYNVMMDKSIECFTIKDLKRNI